MSGAILFAWSDPHAVTFTVTIFFAVILAGLIACLALEEKLHAKKSVIAGLFAVVCLLLGAVCGILPFDKVVVGSHPVKTHEGMKGNYVDEQNAEEHPVEVKPAGGDGHPSDHPLHVDGHRISMPVYIPGIDWGVIAIILGSSLFVDLTSKSGLFTWIAIKVTKASGGDPLKLLFCYGVMTVVFSAVLNNVTAMIIVGSLTAVSLQKLNQKGLLLGFLLTEGLLTNIGGLLTLISSVPNIIVGRAANISFVTFFIVAAPFVIVATLVTLGFGAWLFGIKRLPDAAAREAAQKEVASFDENDGIESWGFFWFGAAMLCLFIVVIATTSVLPWIKDLEMGFVALAFAAIMTIRFKSDIDRFYKSVDWDLLGFFVSLFVVIYVMEHALVLDLIGKGLQPILDMGGNASASSLLVASAVFSSVTDNIPLAAMLAKILGNLGTESTSTLWWSVIFGANLGGNITPIGSASTLVAVTIIHKHKLHLSFGGFVIKAVPFAIVQLLIAIAYVVFCVPLYY